MIQKLLSVIFSHSAPQARRSGLVWCGPSYNELLAMAGLSRDKMSRAVPCLLCLLPLLVTVQAGGQYWWMGDGDAFGDYQDNQVRS